MAGTKNPVGQIHHIAMRVKDFDKSVGFYTRLLGFKQVLYWEDKESRATMVDSGNGSCLEIFSGGKEGDRPEGHFLHLAFAVTNCDAAVKRVADAGHKVTMQPKDVTIPSKPPTPVRIAFFEGPDGEVLEFFQKRQLKTARAGRR
jgi:glyoxylase I family protein